MTHTKKWQAWLASDVLVKVEAGEWAMNSAARKEFDEMQWKPVSGAARNVAGMEHATRSVAGAAAAAANGNVKGEGCGCSWNCENFFVSDYGEKLVRQYTAAAADATGTSGAGQGGKGVEAMQTSVLTAPSYKGCCSACRSAKVPKPDT